MEKRAQENYKKNKSNIDEHNKRVNETYKRGETEDSDLSFQEKKAKRLGIVAPKGPKKPAMLAKQLIKNVPVPEAGELYAFPSWVKLKSFPKSELHD